jgi:hypothetical protein
MDGYVNRAMKATSRIGLFIMLFMGRFHLVWCAAK